MFQCRCNSTREAAEPELRAANGWLLVGSTPRGSSPVSSPVFLDRAPGKGATRQGSLEQRDIFTGNVVCSTDIANQQQTAVYKASRLGHRFLHLALTLPATCKQLDERQRLLARNSRCPSPVRLQVRLCWPLPVRTGNDVCAQTYAIFRHLEVV